MWDRYDAEVDKYGGPLPWTGEPTAWPEAREFGWYVRWGEHVWEECGADDPDAMASRNRLYQVALWDRQQRRFVRVQGGR
jgi:hypothetical protein